MDKQPPVGWIRISQNSLTNNNIQKGIKIREKTEYIIKYE